MNTPSGSIPPEGTQPESTPPTAAARERIALPTDASSAAAAPALPRPRARAPIALLVLATLAVASATSTVRYSRTTPHTPCLTYKATTTVRSPRLAMR